MSGFVRRRKTATVLAFVLVLSGIASFSHAEHLWIVGGNSRLYEIDTETGTTLEASPPADIPGLYAVATVQPGEVFLLTQSHELYRYHRGEGATFVGTVDLGMQPLAFASGSDGLLYVGDTHRFGRFDPVTLAREIIQSAPYAFAGDMSEDSAGTMYGIAGGRLRIIDEATGNLTDVGPVTVGPAYGLAFGLDDRLYVSAGQTIHEMDPATGQTGPALMLVSAGVYDLATGVTCGDGSTDGDPGEECDDGNTTNGDGCDSNCRLTACGNGVVSPLTGEECEDGNLADGDCCDSDCHFEASGSACDDGDACNVDDSCDGAGVCTGTPLDCSDGNPCTQDSCSRLSGCTSEVAPRSGCNVTAGAQAMLLRNDADDTKDSLKWKWLYGQALEKDDFGNPEETTGYSLCIYDQDGDAVRIAASLTVEPGKPWQDGAAAGWAYYDADNSSDGVRRVRLKGNAASTLYNAEAALAAGGVAVPMTEPVSAERMFAMNPSLVVQLVGTNGVCVETEFFDARTNTPERFSAR